MILNIILSNIYLGELLLDMCPIAHIILRLYFCAKIGGRLFDGVSGSNPLASWMSVSFECVGGPITRPEESYRVCVMCLSVIAEH